MKFTNHRGSVKAGRKNRVIVRKRKRVSKKKRDTAVPFAYHVKRINP